MLRVSGSRASHKQTMPRAGDHQDALRGHHKEKHPAVVSQALMTDDLLSIGELAARTGTAASALRYYDQLGLVRPLRRDAGQRRYAPLVIQLVGVVNLLQEVGFKLREVGRLLDSSSSAPVWLDLANRKLGELDRQISKAQTRA
jgi:DNA-binding transcriptional MerR regulator